MGHRALAKPEWQSYFDRISKGLAGRRAEIEVSGTGLGHQTEVKMAQLIGITYDPKNDLVEIALEGLDHLIQHPREIYVVDGVEGLASMEIVDSERQKQIVKLSEPLMLSAPHR